MGERKAPCALSLTASEGRTLSMRLERHLRTAAATSSRTIAGGSFWHLFARTRCIPGELLKHTHIPPDEEAAHDKGGGKRQCLHAHTAHTIMIRQSECTVRNANSTVIIRESDTPVCSRVKVNL